jgi:histone H2A
LLIKPCHLLQAVCNDEEQNKLLSVVTIAQGGVLPSIHSALLPNKAKDQGQPKTTIWTAV